MSTRPDRDRTDLGLSIIPEPTSVHRCRRGWIGDEDHPAPCPVCRPHLIHRPDGWALAQHAPKTEETR